MIAVTAEKQGQKGQPGYWRAARAFLFLGLLCALWPLQALSNQPDDPSQPAAGHFVATYANVLAGQALDRKCNLLGSWQRSRLERFAEELKTQLARQITTQSLNRATKLAAQISRTHADCGDGALKAADHSLFAAFGLVHSRAPGLREEDMTEDFRAFLAWAEPEVAEAIRKKQVVQVARKKAEQASTGQSARFKVSTEAYYIERLCRHLGRAQTRAFWKIIAAAHKKAVALHGATKIRAIQAKASKNAKQQARRCGRKTRLTVEAGYDIARQGLEVATLELP